MTRFLPTAAITGALLISASALAAPAHADGVSSERVTLTYNVEELGSAAGADAILGDLERQARDACTYIAPILRTEITDENCVADVLAQAVSAINDASLTAMYESSSGLALRLDAVEQNKG